MTLPRSSIPGSLPSVPRTSTVPGAPTCHANLPQGLPFPGAYLPCPGLLPSWERLRPKGGFRSQERIYPARELPMSPERPYRSREHIYPAREPLLSRENACRSRENAYCSREYASRSWAYYRDKKIRHNVKTHPILLRESVSTEVLCLQTMGRSLYQSTRIPQAQTTRRPRLLSPNPAPTLAP
jgi:hypothetical protein